MRLQTFANVAAALCLCTRVAGAVPPLVTFHGNVLFDELVYRSVLDLPEGSAATAAEARAASARLLSFLHRAGYVLATVRATAAGGQIAIEIDEGRLEKIIVFGEGIVETLRFRLELSMPAGVFNRPSLERQLQLLAERYRLRSYSYELVPAEVQESYGLQLGQLEPLLAGPGVHPGLRYELHIQLASSPWSRGFSPDVSIGSPEGFGAGGHYREQDFLVADDRWELRTRIAAGLRPHLDTSGGRPVFTRALLEGRWFSPPVLTDSLRPALSLRGDLFSLQRADLKLESFDQATVAASADASVLHPSWMVAAGLGVERRFLFALVKAAGANPLIDQTPRAQTRPYVEALAQVVFDTAELRTDRRHRLELEARFYTGSTSSTTAIGLRAAWQRRFPIGWHEILWQARGTLLDGEVLFPDEESIGGHLNGAFGGAEFARKLLSSGLEFRYSLLRDVVKAGLFYDQVLFGAIDRVGGGARAKSAGAGGPAIHFLIADEFQIDLYAAVGWKTDGSVDFAPGLVLRQVF